jgi:hypothetical protein
MLAEEAAVSGNATVHFIEVDGALVDFFIAA